jgi:hypothetical protein
MLAIWRCRWRSWYVAARNVTASASAVVLDYAVAMDEGRAAAVAKVITAVGVPQAPAVGMVSAFVGIPTLLMFLMLFSPSFG